MKSLNRICNVTSLVNDIAGPGSREQGMWKQYQWWEGPGRQAHCLGVRDNTGRCPHGSLNWPLIHLQTLDSNLGGAEARMALGSTGEGLGCHPGSHYALCLYQCFHTVLLSLLMLCFWFMIIPPIHSSAQSATQKFNQCMSSWIKFPLKN